MNRLVKKVLLSCLLTAAVASTAEGALTKDFYAKSSVLSSGNWVKVGVDETGVYEISYETLRQMGFSNPEKVSVYGRGGRVLSESFVSNAGVPVLTDDLAPVKVLHEGGKLYFYGLGPDEISFETNSTYETGGYFSRKSRNIYTFRGYYFLTDSKPVASMTTQNYDTSASSIVIDKGVSYVYHELDSVQNTTGSGQLFWGEAVGYPGLRKRTWNVSMPDAAGPKGVMECDIYFPSRDFGADATVSYGFSATSGYFTTPYQQNAALYYAPHQPRIAPIEIPGDKGEVFVEFLGIDMGEFSNLDFWVVSYESGIPTMKDADGVNLNQRLIALPTVVKNTNYQIALTNSASLVVLDVSTATDPQRLTVKQQGPDGKVGVRSKSKTPVLVIFDKDQPQRQICGYEKAYYQIENQNLHSYKEEGADFLIITVPSLKPYAEELATLHREHDGIKVIVATTEEVYNEFSGGVPDPMAYRSFARMLYFSDCKPKNILLFGPLNSDFRGVKVENDPSETIIAYQSPSISISRGAHNINDFYGMMSDKFRTDYYERNDVQIGVGILPIHFPSEARIVLDKIKNYLERTDHAYYLNRFTGVGGLGDDHTHEIQVRDIYTHIRSFDNQSTIYTPLAIDAYGNTEGKKKFINQINEGCGMFSYFGHGAEQFLGLDRYFFNAGDVYQLRNRILPFALFGGCQITNTDRGYRGLGETIVTATPYGCIGSIVSARDTWSGQNYEFFKQFYTSLYSQGMTASSPRRSQPVTIGEVYKDVKNYSTYSNELAYQLLCDPALVIPSINRSISARTDMDDGTSALQPGDSFKLKGNVLDASGNPDASFNGEIVVRLNEPELQKPVGAVQNGSANPNLIYSYRDAQVGMTTAQVTNGAFEANIHVPSSMSKWEGDQALIFLCAYDPNTRVAAGSLYEATVGAPKAQTAESTDKVAPVIETLAFNETDCTFDIAVSDNVALNLSSSPLDKGLFLYIDGKERNEAHIVEPVIESGRAAYSKNVFVNGLTYGSHSARLKVKDAAGNTTEQEITFIYQPAMARYVIARSNESTPGLTRISIEGEAPASASIVVISAAGTEVWRGNFSGNSVEWNHTGADGAKVAPGHYKAYLIETGQEARKGHSATIDIPVI